MFGFGKKDYFKPGPEGEEALIAFTGKSITVQVYDVPALLGRGGENVDVAVNDATVSRKHLLIGTYGDRLTVTDQGSTGGTVINGEELEPGVPYYLSDGDKISIGRLSFTCHLNKKRTGKKLKLPKLLEKDTAGDTSEMSKADLKAAAAKLEEKEELEEQELEAAAGIVKDAERVISEDASDEAFEEISEEEQREAYEAAGAQEPVIRLMPDPVLDESEAAPDEQRGDTEVSGEEQADAAETSERSADEAAPDGQRGDALASGPEDLFEGGPAQGKCPSFVYYSGSAAVESFEITTTPFVIGRAKSDYTPGAAGVSRRHCFIDRTGDTYYITDLESTNGVWINGRRIRPYNRTALAYGDIIGIGDRVYKYSI